ncbi:MAG: chorismate mutase [Cyanobacteria bacterium RYN_339]|nr:chorismate mutase [Cyanobacteria bacterium RYN_339]
MTMYCRGIRGATTVETNTKQAIVEATRELLDKLVEANQIDPNDVGSIFFTATPDLDAEFPAVAARQLGWSDAAMLCAHEMGVPGSMPMCLRILIHWNTMRSAADIKHIYIRGAQGLRPDRASV